VTYLHALYSLAELDRFEVQTGGLYAFVKLAWPHVESAPYVDSPHIPLVCKHLEAVSRFEIDRLVINIPPGCSKSLIVSVFWPAWHWAEVNGGEKWMNLSGDGSLSIRDATRVKELVSSDWYQERWGPGAGHRKPICLAKDAPKKGKARRSQRSDAASIFWTSQKGLRFSTSIRGRAIGWHANIQVCDDPIKPELLRAGGAKAREALKKTEELWQGTFSTRKADPQRFARVLIMQRLHHSDLAQKCIDEGYVHLNLPMEYDPDRHCKTVIGGDWRTEKGELLAPGRFTPEAVAKGRRELGPVQAAAQYDQNPTPDGGSVFHRPWLEHRWSRIPAGAYFWSSWDCTFKDSESSDYVVGQVWARWRGTYYLADQYREKASLPTTCRAILAQLSKWPEISKVLVEDKANGSAVISVLQSKVPFLVPVKPEGGKESRAHAVTGVFEAGMVYLPDQPWVVELVREFLEFPMGKHDDQVDAATQAISGVMEDGYLDQLEQAVSALTSGAA
jgi:predicted phage terminase large subunit-like protein